MNLKDKVLRYRKANNILRKRAAEDSRIIDNLLRDKRTLSELLHKAGKQA